MFTKHTLKNGLRIVLMPMSGTETVTVSVTINAGSRYEMNEEAGLSHFLEHMAFKGTKKRPTAIDISKDFDAVGAEFNAFTSKELISFYAKVGSHNLDLALDVISDIFLNSTFKNEEIQREKGVILEEMHLYQDTPMRYVDDLFEELLFDETSLGKMIIGNEKTIKSFSREMFISYLSSLYCAANIVICVAGKIDSENVLNKVESYFKTVTEGPTRSRITTPTYQIKPKLKLHWKKTDQAHLMIGFLGYPLNHRRRIAAELLATILGGGMSSRLFHSIRERRGLAYYVRAGSHSYTDSGYIAAQAGVTNVKIDLAIKQILVEFKKLKTTKVSSKELRKAKDYIKGHTLLSLESSDEVAYWGAMQEILENKILTTNELFQQIDKVTPNDIINVAREVFTNQRLNMAVIGPFKDIKQFEKLLKI